MGIGRMEPAAWFTESALSGGEKYWCLCSGGLRREPGLRIRSKLAL